MVILLFIFLSSNIYLGIVGKIISIRGTVIKAAHTKLMCTYLPFSCSNCTGVQIVKQNDGVYTLPSKCKTQECKARSNFIPLHSSKYNKTIAWKTIKIQEVIGFEVLS